MPSENRTQQQIQSLLEDQQSSLERLRIHQRNLRILLEQKAKFGIAVPLNILNDIEIQENEIRSIHKQLDLIDIEIAELTQAQHNFGSGNSDPVPTIVNIDGVNYPIDMPYPFLRVWNRMTPTQAMESIMHYAGGFEIRTIMRPSQPMQYMFYRHGRRITPIIDNIHKRVSIPAGAHITVSKLYMHTLKKISIADIDTKNVTEDRWTILSPSEPQESLTIIEYPQGYNYYIVTSKLAFQDKHEVWMVYPIGDNKEGHSMPITLWFYIDDWNVAPVVDKQSLTLSFPVLNS